MEFKIPESLELQRLLHFEKEEEYALPPLGLLSLSKQDKISSEMKSVLTITERLKADPYMIEEHNGIVIALQYIYDAEYSSNPLITQ
ncbi:MAG: hypothetical protein WAM14_23240 [Candidatus Nitrosopolaris sp.]